MKIIVQFLTLILVSALAGGMIAVCSQQQASAIIVHYKAVKKLTHEFEKNVLSGQWNPGDTPPTRELLASYIVDVNRILLGGPDTLPPLRQSYERDVTSIFEQSPQNQTRKPNSTR
jgi:hypothetical protein